MKRQLVPPLSFIAVLALCLGIVPGCGDDDNVAAPDPIGLEDFAGTWTGTQFVVTSQANPQMQLDLIAVGGSFTMSTAGDGTFTGESQVPDFDNPGQMLTFELAGTVSLVDQTHMDMTFTPEIPPLFTSGVVEFTLTGDTLVLADPNFEFDFDQNGTDEPASFEGTLVRN